MLKQSFDAEESDFQNFYYYHEAVLDRFSITLDLYDWEKAEDVERKPALFGRLRKTMSHLGN